jgi:hypothetical protein
MSIDPNISENMEKIIEYLLAKVNILERNFNKGEKDEVLMMIELFHLNQTKQYDKLVDIFGDEASDGIHILCMDISTRDISTRDIITDINKLSKAKGTNKADCIIKMRKTDYTYYISLKSKNGANPAVLNHTPRNAKVFKQDGILYKHIDTIDIILKEYIDKRKAKIIGEDTSIYKLESLENQSIKSNFMNVLSYFVFEGSGKGDSICKANSILYYENKNFIFTKCRDNEEKKEYIQSICDKVIISLRDKGMPKNGDDYCHPWLFNDCKSDGTIKYKGSLHIRIN